MNVLFASGVIRTPYRFMHSIIDLKENQKVSKIVLSVWDDEIDKFDGLRSFLNIHGVRLVETKEPDVKTLGFIKHQMVCLERALSLFCDDDIIFKTRCDLYIDPKFFDEVICNYLDWGSILCDEFSVFKNKIWIMYYELTKPFYLSDEAFCGRKCDINLLVNYIEYDHNKIGSGLTHIRRFINPFIQKFPLLNYYLDFAAGYANIGCNQRFEKLNNQINLPYFSVIHYLYIKILNSNFHVAYPKNDVTTVYFDSNVRVDVRKFKSNFSKKFVNCPTGGQIFVFDNELIRSILENRVDARELPHVYSELVASNPSYVELERLFKKNNPVLVSDFDKNKYRKSYWLLRKVYSRKFLAMQNEISSSPLPEVETLPTKSYVKSKLFYYIGRFYEKLRLFLLCN